MSRDLENVRRMSEVSKMGSPLYKVEIINFAVEEKGKAAGIVVLPEPILVECSSEMYYKVV